LADIAESPSMEHRCSPTSADDDNEGRRCNHITAAETTAPVAERVGGGCGHTAVAVTRCSMSRSSGRSIDETDVEQRRVSCDRQSVNVVASRDTADNSIERSVSEVALAVK